MSWGGRGGDFPGEVVSEQGPNNTQELAIETLGEECPGKGVAAAESLRQVGTGVECERA